MAFILKVKHEDSVHRVPLREEQVNYDSIMETIQRFYPGEVTAKYLDDEGDLCTLCAATFSDFLSLSAAATGGGKKILRLELFHAELAPAAAAARPEEPAELEGPNPIATIFKLLKGGKCKGKGKGKWFGKGKWCGKGEEGDARAHEQDAKKQPGEWPGAAFDLEELFRHLGDLDGLAQQGVEDGGMPRPPWGMMKMCALGPLLCGHASGAKKVAVALWQLHSSGMLNAKCVAAVLANSLDELVPLAAEHSSAIECFANLKPEVTREALQVLLCNADGTEGLEACADKMRGALMTEPIPAGEVLLDLLTTLDAMPFGARVSFIQAVYESQQERIDSLREKAAPFLAMLPPVPAEHQCVVCDGCGEGPLRGPRFKCKSLQDFDLCARCLAEKDTSFDGKCAGLEFEMITGTHHTVMLGQMHHFKGEDKGKGKGKGKCKGKGKFKGKFGAAVVEGKRPCACGDCGYMVTWHDTHCCNACRDTNGKNHGPMCHKVPRSPEEPAHEPEADDATMMGGGAPPEAAVAAADDKKDDKKVPSEPAVNDQAPSPHYDLSFPVALGDGHHMTIQWNIGDDPQQVAESFAAQHGVPQEELHKIRFFVEGCTAAAIQQTKWAQITGRE